MTANQKLNAIPAPLSAFETSAYERAVIERLDLILAELRDLRRFSADGNSISVTVVA